MEEKKYYVYINNIFNVPIYIHENLSNDDADKLIKFLDDVPWYPGDKLATA